MCRCRWRFRPSEHLRVPTTSCGSGLSWLSEAVSFTGCHFERSASSTDMGERSNEAELSLASLPVFGEALKKRWVLRRLIPGTHLPASWQPPPPALEPEAWKLFTFCPIPAGQAGPGPPRTLAAFLSAVPLSVSFPSKAPPSCATTEPGTEELPTCVLPRLDPRPQAADMCWVSGLRQAGSCQTSSLRLLGGASDRPTSSGGIRGSWLHAACPEASMRGPLTCCSSA